MKRPIRALAVREEAPLLNISSLVDVAFLLLIFFLVTSSLQSQETDLTTKFPGTMVAPGSPDALSLVVKIDAAGSIFVEENLVSANASQRSLPALDRELEGAYKFAKATDKTPAVVIIADDHAAHQRLVDVVNAISKSGITHITFDEPTE